MESLAPCVCRKHAPKPYRPLTTLMLECWLRKHDRRPYHTLLLSRKLFEEIYHRHLDHNDYAIISSFLRSGTIDHFEIIYMPMPDVDICQQMLRTLANITHVSLCQVDMQVGHLRTLLECPCQLISLRLSGNRFTQAHTDVMREFLLRNTTIAYLDVGYCDIDPVRFAAVADGILNCSSLRAIDISRIVPSHPQHMPDASKIAVIIAMLIWPNVLHEVHAKHQNMDGHDIEPIVECLNRCENLVYLDLGSNRLGAHGAKIIFEAIRATPHLIGLDISNNNLGEHGGLEIANQMPCTKLRFLDIGHNSIPEHAMEMILFTLKKGTPMRILNMYGNKFDLSVGKALRRVLDARVLLITAVDVKTTYDADEGGFRIVPLANERTRYNYRYFRAHPFIRKYDVTPNLVWHTVNRRKLLVNGLFLDPIFVDLNGHVYTIDAHGRHTEVESSRVHNF